MLGQRSGWQYVRELNRPARKWPSAWAVCRHVRIPPTPIKSFLPCDVTYAISEPRGSKVARKIRSRGYSLATHAYVHVMHL